MSNLQWPFMKCGHYLNLVTCGCLYVRTPPITTIVGTCNCLHQYAFFVSLACPSSNVATVRSSWVWQDGHHPCLGRGHGILCAGMGQPVH